MSSEGLGGIPLSWNARRLDELAEIIDSLHKTPSYSDTGYPMVRVTDINNVALNLSSTLRVTAEVYREFTRRYAPKRNDIVMSRVGTYGNTCYVDTDEPFCLGQNTVLISPLINPRYLYFCLRSPLIQRQIESLVVGSTQKTISLKSLRSLQIPTPPTEEMDEIAQILGSLDDKIDLNRRMNATLESMARALFKSWFVDFDPVRAKAEGRQPDGIDAATAALFPDSFEDSELGPIPAGWRILPLDQIANFLNGLALQKFPAEGNESLPVIKIRELRQGYADNSSDRASNEINSAYIVDNGNVLFSWSGSLLVDFWTGGRGALNQHLFKVSSDEFPEWFYFSWTQYHLGQFIEIAANKATTMGHIQRQHLKEAFCIVPNTGMLSALGRIIEPIYESIVAHRLQAQTLGETRDILLPRLLSGDLQVLQ